MCVLKDSLEYYCRAHNSGVHISERPRFNKCAYAYGIHRFIIYIYRRFLLFRSHLIPSRRCVILLVALAIVRPDATRRCFCLASSLPVSPFAFRSSAIHEGLKITDMYHGHAYFPKSGPINRRGQFDSDGPPCRFHFKRDTYAKRRARTRYTTR